MKSFLIDRKGLILIVLLAAFLRFWQMGVVPPSLYVDEVSNGYNAYSILKTGRDEYGNFLPLTFRAFGDYNPALSVYLLVPSIALFGLNEWGVRFPSALLGTLTVALTYFLARSIFQTAHPRGVFQESPRPHPGGVAKSDSSLKNVALLATFFLAISPWHLQFSRYDHEANFMSVFIVLGVTLFLYSGKNFKLLIAASIAFGLALNSYHAAKIWVPLLLLALIFLYRHQIRTLCRPHVKRWIVPLAILAISAIPIFTNLQHSLIRATSVGIIESQNPAKNFVSGYLSHFAPNFLFVVPDNIGRHAVEGMGHLYIFELPLLVIGLARLIKSNLPHKKLILAWLLLAPIPAALATPTPHALRAITFLPVFSLIAAYGLVTIAGFTRKYRLVTLAVISIVAVYNIATYFHLYWGHYPKLKAPDWADGYKEMVQYVDSIKDNYEVVAMTNFYGRPYIYTLFWSKYDPQLYHPQSQNKEKFGKFEFFGASWEKKTAGKVLVIRPKWQIPDPPPKYLKFVESVNGDLVFRISEE